METLVATTFLIIVAFSAINLFINGFIYFACKQRTYLNLAFFWLSLILNFVIQGIAQGSEIKILLGFAFSALPVNLLVYSTLNFMKIRYPLGVFSLITLVGFVSIFILNTLPISFTLKALPIAVAEAIPLFFTAYYILWILRASATPVLKIHGVVLFLFGVHGINFALFRMAPQAQLWGWPVAYALYQLLAGVLPALTLDYYHRAQNTLLTGIIEEKTRDLKASNKLVEAALENKIFLLRTLTHDIGNPLTVIQLNTHLALKEIKNPREALLKVAEMSQRIESLRSQIKLFESTETQNSKMIFEEVNVRIALDHCLKLFEHRVAEKNLKISYDANSLGNIVISANRNSVSNTIFPNILNNAIKFSHPGGIIKVSAKHLSNNTVGITFGDNGVGIPQGLFQSLFNFESKKTRVGTQGEEGTGFGLPIIKKMMLAFNGDLIINSRVESPNESGYTEVTLVFQEANKQADLSLK